VPVVVDAERPEALPARLWRAGVGVRLPGSWNAGELARRVDYPEQVHFREAAMEAVWSSKVLGLI
jgi:hypothetical protein